MSRVYRPLDPDHIFTSREEVENHLHSKLHSSTRGLVGTELELFVHASGEPPSFGVIEKLLLRMRDLLPGAVAVNEKGRAVGVHVPDLGDICLEPGGQVELSTKPCDDVSSLAAAHRGLFAALETAAGELGLSVTGQGHMPSFLEAGDMPRSRFSAYYRYCRAQHGEAAEELIKTMKSACGLQVNVDPMGDDFHEIYRALLLVDLAVSFSQRSERQKRLQETYASLFPEQVTPVFNALAAKSNDSLMTLIVDRLLTLKVPFIPAADAPEGFKSTLDVFGYPPTVGQLLEKGLLTREILDNSLSLQMTMPNLRRHGVVETRAPDSVDSPAELERMAALYHRYAYDKSARGALLERTADIDIAALERAFAGRFSGALPPEAVRLVAAVMSPAECGGEPQNKRCYSI